MIIFLRMIRRRWLISYCYNLFFPQTHHLWKVLIHSIILSFHRMLVGDRFRLPYNPFLPQTSSAVEEFDANIIRSFHMLQSVEDLDVSIISFFHRLPSGSIVDNCRILFFRLSPIDLSITVMPICGRKGWLYNQIFPQRLLNDQYARLYRLSRQDIPLGRKKMLHTESFPSNAGYILRIAGRFLPAWSKSVEETDVYIIRSFHQTALR